MQPDVRWKQRLQNFRRAVALIQEVRERELNSLSQLEKEGVVQRFEMAIELGWKTLKDRMQNDGLQIDIISPKTVIRQAFESRYITEVEVWLDMVSDRNILSHTYDLETLEEILPHITGKYLDTFEKLLQTIEP